MCAFGIIIGNNSYHLHFSCADHSLAGDTIPSVLRFLFPSITHTPVLSLLGQRQFVIALCTIAVSYPLSLHRSIDKLAKASSFALAGMLVIVFSVLVRAPLTPPGEPP